MTIGIPSLIEYRTVKDHLRLCAENGFDFFELNFSFPWFQIEDLNPERMSKLSCEYRVGYSFHLNDSFNPFDFSSDMRRAWLNYTDKVFMLADFLGVKRIIMHLVDGIYSAVNGNKIYANEVCLETYLENVGEFAHKCNNYLKDSGVLVCIENTNGYRSFQKIAIETMLEYQCFGLTFDIGHNYKAGGMDEMFILEHQNRLKHFHVHNATQKANHFSLDEGVIDVKKYLDMIVKLDCTCVVEVKESSSLLRSRNYLVEHGYL
jgi:sugar phosphate isomerase/epimerase